MLFIPAIDLIDGKCVRLTQGSYSKKTEYSGNPVDVAKKFVNEGAKYLHIVDLDSARNPEKNNLKVIEKIVKAVDVPVEVGGGIRDIKKVKMLFSIGVDRVIIGTLLVKKPGIVSEITNNYADRIAAAIDARNGMVYVSGWTESGNVPAVELGLKAKELGITTIIYTDIQRDGTLSGPNLSEIKKMTKITGLSLIAAGGIHSFEDLKKIKTLENNGVIGVISGMAIYEGKITVRKAIDILNK